MGATRVALATDCAPDSRSNTRTAHADGEKPAYNFVLCNATEYDKLILSVSTEPETCTIRSTVSYLNLATVKTWPCLNQQTSRFIPAHTSGSTSFRGT